MKLQIRRDVAAIVVIEIGEEDFDGSVAPDFKARMSDEIQNGDKVIIDLAQVNFIDSSAMGAMLALGRNLRNSGGKLVISSPSERVMIAFELIRLQNSISVVDDRESAFDVLNKIDS